MPTLDIFQDENFDVVHLSKRLNDIPRIPTKIGDLGLFAEEGITTTHLYIEKSPTGLHLVPARARGAPGEPVTIGKPNRVAVDAVHLPQRGAVMADEVQNLRSFGLPNGTDSDLASVTALVDKKLAKMKLNLDLTIEYQRVGALKGQILDYDGTTVLLDLFSVFGKTRQTFSMHLDVTTTKVRSQCVAIRRLIEAKLGGLGYTGLRGLASPSFMDLLTSHDSVEKTFLYQQGAQLRVDPTANDQSFVFGGIVWDEYLGTIVNGSDGTSQAPAIPFIEDGAAYVFPTGVSDLFFTTYSPADYVEAVNTVGLPYYVKQEPMRMGKGVEFESQSNPLSICSRPEAIVQVWATTAP